MKVQTSPLEGLKQASAKLEKLTGVKGMGDAHPLIRPDDDDDTDMPDIGRQQFTTMKTH